MKCLVCGLELDDELVRCPRCKFYVPGATDDSEESRKRIKELADEYRRKYWSAAKVFLEVYTNAVKDDKVVTVKTDELFIGETDKINDGEIAWNGEKFARLHGDCQLNIVVDREGEARKKLKLSVENPKISNYWHVGLKKQSDDRYCITVGSNSKYAESESFSVN